MQNLSFSARRPKDYLEADVTFATADDLLGATPICRTAYIAYEIEKEKLHLLTAWMHEGGVVVIYTKLPATAKAKRKEPKHGADARTANQKSYQTALR
jgi:hypothetical protein